MCCRTCCDSGPQAIEHRPENFARVVLACTYVNALHQCTILAPTLHVQILLYGFHVFRDFPSLEILPRVMPPSCCEEVPFEGTESVVNSSDSVATSATSMARKKQKRSGHDDDSTNADMQMESTTKAIETAAAVTKRQAQLTSRSAIYAHLRPENFVRVVLACTNDNAPHQCTILALTLHA
jgi:hypothetical protein